MTRYLLLLCLLAAPVSADFVLLENGRRLRGVVVEETEKEIVLQLPSVKTRLPRSKVKQIIKEDNRAYYRVETASFLERGMYGDAVKFGGRGLESFPDAARLKGMVDAAGRMQEAGKKAELLAFDAAIGLAEQAAKLAPASKRIARELARLRKTKQYWAEHGSLPGAWVETRGTGVRLLHHQPVLARQLKDRIETLVRQKVEAYRSTVSHKLPRDAVFVLEVHRSEQAYRKALPDPKKFPQGLLPGTDRSRLVTDTRGTTYQQVAAGELEPMVSRYVLIQLYKLLPLWALEGCAAGGLEKGKPASGKPTSPASKLLLQRHYGGLDAAARQRLAQEARRLVQFFVAHRSGRFRMFRAFRKARTEMMKDIRLILKGTKKHRGSLRFEVMFARYVPEALSKEFKLKDPAALDAAYAAFCETGKLKK